MRIAVLTPMWVEFDEALVCLDSKEELSNTPFPVIQGRIADNDAVLMQCGIGKVNAAAATVSAITTFGVDCILCFGCAGSVSSTVKQSDFIVGTAYSYYDVWCGNPNAFGQVQDMPAIYKSSPDLLAYAKVVDVAASKHFGALISGDQFVDTGHGIETICRLVPNVLAADMESAAIAQVCYRFHIPFLALRVASDEVCPSDEEHKAMFRSFWQGKCHAAFEPARRFLKQLPENLASIATD